MTRMSGRKAYIPKADACTIDKWNGNVSCKDAQSVAQALNRWVERRGTIQLNDIARDLPG